MESFKLDVVTPRGNFVSEVVVEVSIPTTGGEIGVLPDHAPMTTLIGTGLLTYVPSEGHLSETHLVISGGSARVKDDGAVVVLADEVEIPAGDITFVRQRLAELRENADSDPDLSTIEKVTLLVEAYTEIESKYSGSH